MIGAAKNLYDKIESIVETECISEASHFNRLDFLFGFDGLFFLQIMNRFVPYECAKVTFNLCVCMHQCNCGNNKVYFIFILFYLLL